MSQVVLETKALFSPHWQITVAWLKLVSATIGHASSGTRRDPLRVSIYVDLIFLLDSNSTVSIIKQACNLQIPIIALTGSNTNMLHHRSSSRVPRRTGCSGGCCWAAGRWRAPRTLCTSGSTCAPVSCRGEHHETLCLRPHCFLVAWPRCLWNTCTARCRLVLRHSIIRAEGRDSFSLQ